MALADLLPQRAVHTRPTATVLSQATWPFTATLAWSSPQPARVKANGIDLTSGVTLAVTGFNGATAQTESLVLPAAAPQLAISTQRWTSITQIASADTPTGWLLVEAIEQGGKPVTQYQVVNPDFPCRLNRRLLRSSEAEAGTVLDEAWILYTTQDGIRPSDRFLVSGVTYVVDNVDRVYGKISFHHSEVFLSRLPSPV